MKTIIKLLVFIFTGAILAQQPSKKEVDIKEALKQKQKEAKLVDLYQVRAAKEAYLVNRTRETDGISLKRIPDTISELQDLNARIDTMEEVLGDDVTQKLRKQEHTMLVNLSYIRTIEVIAIEIAQNLVESN